MKMRELVKRTEISREKIHFFTREKMLPAIEKPSPNQAIYNEKHVERIKLIKDLQDKYFIPITVIKKIVAQLEISPVEEDVLWIKANYFQPMDHLLPQTIRGEDKFMEFTGLKAGRLQELMDYGIIKAEQEDGVKLFGHDSIKLGKLFGDMRDNGIYHERGFSKSWIKEIHDMVKAMVTHSIDVLDDGIEKASIQQEEARILSRKAAEYFSMIVYHMGHDQYEEAIHKYVQEKYQEDP